MKHLAIFALLSGAIAAPAGVSCQSDANTTAINAVAQKVSTYKSNLESYYSDGCTPDNVSVRKSWSALNRGERLEYLTAVDCLINLPGETDSSLCPGCRNRLDDYVYAHINQTNFIHRSGLLLPWHRKFVGIWEKELQDKCGLTFGQPYWDWPEYSQDQTKGPVFDGSDTSFGTNGEYIPAANRVAENVTIVDVFQSDGSPVSIPQFFGSGGGCISNGHFSNLNLHLGTVLPANRTEANKYGLDYNPRCIDRDMSQTTSQENLTYTRMDAILSQPDIQSFHESMEVGMHPMPHIAVGGIQNDFYASPGDPLFFLLHAGIDRVWTIWQGQDFESRQDGLDGTVTILNLPPSANATVDTIMYHRSVSTDTRVGDVMKTVNDKQCYRWE